VGGANAGFDRAERVFHGLASLTHSFWIFVEPALHGFDALVALGRGV